jgi:hypothetical protein
MLSIGLILSTIPSKFIKLLIFLIISSFIGYYFIFSDYDKRVELDKKAIELNLERGV